MTRRLIVVLALLLVVGACRSPAATAESIEGTWYLEWWENDGERTVVEIGGNTVDQPWVELGENMNGDGGCNGFGGDYSFSDGLLLPGEIFSELAFCGPEDGQLMTANEILLDALWADDSGIRVEVGAGTMTWSAGETTLSFNREALPVPPTEPPPPITEIGALDCSPGIVIEDRVPDEGQRPLDILQANSPAVVEIRQTDPLHWDGLNPNGAVIAILALGDARGADYQLWTCDPPLGLSAR